VAKGARRADAALGMVGHAWRAEDGGVATGARHPHGASQWAGPLWLGPLHDRAVVERLAPTEAMGTRARLARLRELWLEEAELPPLLVDVNRLSGDIGTRSPSIARLVEELRARGFRAGRSHTNPQGVKTDAPMEELKSAMRDLG